MEPTVRVDGNRGVGRRRGDGPSELDSPLQNCIEASAAEALARHSDSTWTRPFEVPGLTVTVTDEAVVVVDRARPAPV